MNKSRTVEFPSGEIAVTVLKAGGYRTDGVVNDLRIYERHDELCKGTRIGTLDSATGVVKLNEKHPEADINYEYINTLLKDVFV